MGFGGCLGGQLVRTRGSLGTGLLCWTVAGPFSYTLPPLTPLAPGLPSALQLKRFEHEGDWSRALLTYDLALQHLGPAASGGAGSGGPTQQTQQQQVQRPALGSPGSQAAPGAGVRGGMAGAGASFEGISRQAAIAGLLRSLAHLGAGHLVSAYAQSADVADSPAAAAALSLGQWGQLGGGPSTAAAAEQGTASPLMPRCRRRWQGCRQAAWSGAGARCVARSAGWWLAWSPPAWRGRPT